MSARARGAAAVAVFVGVAALAVALSLRGADVDPGVPVETVRRGPFAREIHADGVLAAENATVLSVPVTAMGGLRIAWLAEDGSEVREGDVVVRFDPGEMERQLHDGRSERDTVRGKRDGTEVRENAALANLDRDAALAALELDYADRFQSKDPEIFSRVEIVESRIDRDLALGRRDHALGVRSVREDLVAAELDLLDLERRKAELRIEEARDGLDALEIRAPHDGVFVLRREWGDVARPGEVVWSGQPIAEIPRRESMKVEAFVLEADAGGLSPGAPAEVALEAHPEERFPATIRTVAAVAKRRSRWSPVQYFSVELALERTDPVRMKPGQRARATMRMDAAEDVLTVSREALFDGQGGARFVWRREGGGFEKVEVVPGAVAPGRVVIESGLREGDVVALVDPDSGAIAPEGAPGGGAAPRLPGGAP